MLNNNILQASSPEALARSIGGIEFRGFQRYISQRIMKGISEGGHGFVVSVPPGHGKSELCSKWLPLWLLNNDPKRKIMCCSYNQTNSNKWGRAVRNTITQNPEILNVRLSKDAKAKSLWHTSKEGSFLCAGVCGTLTGNHANFVLIDDPHKDWKEAMSEPKREAVIDWYKTVLSTRILPQCTIVLVQTRWHESDLAGYILKNNGKKEKNSKFPTHWEYIRIPAISEGKGDLLNRPKGEALLPGEFDIKYLENQKRLQGSMKFSALYQQTPQADTGNLFLRECWQRYTPAAKPKKFIRFIQTWDTAYKSKKENAYSTCVIIAQDDSFPARFYMLSIWRKKCKYMEVRQKMYDFWKNEKCDIILLEDRASGQSLLQELREFNIPIVPVSPCADKLTRAWSVTPLWEDGKIFIAAGESWADETIDGFASYPAGDWTDVVDAASQGLVFMSHTSGALDGNNLPNLRIGRRKECFRFGANLAGFSVSERSHWYRDNLKPIRS